MQRHCLASLCIFSFILCSCSFRLWKWGQHNLNPSWLCGYSGKKGEGEKKGKGFSTKEKRSLNMRFFRHGTNPACSSFSPINGLSEPLVKWVHYSSLLTTILVFERVFSHSRLRGCDPYCSGMTPINTEMAKVKNRRIRVGRKKAHKENAL